MACGGLDPEAERYIAVQPSKTSGKLLLTDRGTETQTAHTDFVVKDEESPAYSFSVACKVNANLIFTPGSRLYLHFSGKTKKFLTEAFVREEV